MGFKRIRHLVSTCGRTNKFQKLWNMFQKKRLWFFKNNGIIFFLPLAQITYLSWQLMHAAHTPTHITLSLLSQKILDPSLPFSSVPFSDSPSLFASANSLYLIAITSQLSASSHSQLQRPKTPFTWRRARQQQWSHQSPFVFFFFWKTVISRLQIHYFGSCHEIHVSCNSFLVSVTFIFFVMST